MCVCMYSVPYSREWSLPALCGYSPNTRHDGRGNTYDSCQKYWSIITIRYSLRWSPFFLGGGFRL